MLGISGLWKLSAELFGRELEITNQRYWNITLYLYRDSTPLNITLLTLFKGKMLLLFCVYGLKNLYETKGLCVSLFMSSHSIEDRLRFISN